MLKMMLFIEWIQYEVVRSGRVYLASIGKNLRKYSRAK